MFLQRDDNKVGLTSDTCEHQFLVLNELLQCLKHLQVNLCQKKLQGSTIRRASLATRTFMSCVHMHFYPLSNRCHLDGSTCLALWEALEQGHSDTSQYPLSAVIGQKQCSTSRKTSNQCWAKTFVQCPETWKERMNDRHLKKK